MGLAWRDLTPPTVYMWSVVDNLYGSGCICVGTGTENHDSRLTPSLSIPFIGSDTLLMVAEQESLSHASALLEACNKESLRGEKKQSKA